MCAGTPESAHGPPFGVQNSSTQIGLTGESSMVLDDSYFDLVGSPTSEDAERCVPIKHVFTAEFR